MCKCGCCFKLWEYTLYAVNFCLFGLGIASIVVGALMYNSDKLSYLTEGLPFDAQKFAIVIFSLGAGIVVFALLGCYGTKVNEAKHSDGQHNWWLTLYFFLMFVFFIVYIAAGALLLTVYILANQEFDSWKSTYKDNWDDNIANAADGLQSETFKSIQNELECCFMFSSDQSPPNRQYYGDNGDSCVADHPSFVQKDCLDRIKEAVIGQFRTVGIVAIITGIFMFLGSLASFCLCCCRFEGYSANY